MKKTLTTLSAGLLLAGAANAALFYSEDFTSLTLEAQSESTNNPTITATTTGGTWSAGGTTEGAAIVNVAGNNQLNFQRPNTTGGWSGSTVVLAGALFTDGAGTYTLKYDYANQTNTTARLFAAVWGVNYNTGTVNTLNHVAGAWNRTVPTTSVTTTGDATATLLNSRIDATVANGLTLDFIYDGSSDVMLVFGGGRSNANFGNSRLDNVSIVPEPSSAMLLGGLGVLALLRRRK